MSYLGGVLGHIAEAEFLGHFGGSEGIDLRVCRRIIGMCWCGVVVLLADMRQVRCWVWHDY